MICLYNALFLFQSLNFININNMKKFLKILSLGVFVTSVTSCSSSGDEPTPQPQVENPVWTLVWEEDFDNDYIDTTVWSKLTKADTEARKYMSENPECFGFKDGCLVLKAIKNPNAKGQEDAYLTGGITTQHKFSFAPGKVEVRAKLPMAKGTWPAIWMMPYDNTEPWPTEGEVDIMEHLGTQTVVHQTVHSNYTQKYPDAMPHMTEMPSVNMDDFNTYGVTISADSVNFYINGVKTMGYPKVMSLLSEDQFPFYRNWYLMIDMQLGGWAGEIDKSVLPSEMQVDWVKYYKLTE